MTRSWPNMFGSSAVSSAHIKRRDVDAKVKHKYAQAAHKALTGVWARPYNRALVYAKNLDPNLTKDVYAAWSRNKRKRQTTTAAQALRN